MRLARKLVLALCALTIPALVSAKPIYKKSDWILEDTGNACVASTTGKLNRQSYALSVVLDKTGLRPIEVLILPYTSPATVGLFQARVPDGTNYNFAAMPTSPDGRDSFWNIPRGTAALISAMKRGSRIDLFPASGETGVLPFSLMGVTATLDKMAKLCVQTNPLDSADFESRFVPAQASTLDGTKLDATQTNYLHSVIDGAVAAYRGVLVVEAELNALEARYAGLTNELGQRNKELGGFNSDLARHTAARDAALSTIAQANADIASLQSAISADQQRLVSAKLDHDNAVNVLSPLVARHDQLLAQLNRANSNVATAQANLDSTERAIVEKNQQIDALEHEQRRLSNELPMIHNQVEQARRQRDNADRNVRNFDVRNEIFLREQNDPWLRQANSDIANLQPRLRQATEQTRQSERIKNRAKQELEQCQSSTIVIGPGPTPNPEIDPIDPNPVTPTPPDCSREREAFQQARQAFQQAQNDQQQIEAQLNQRIGDRDQIVGRIQSDVNQEYTQLQRQANLANREFNQLEAQESALESRLLQIQNDLPSRHAELQTLETRRGNAQNALFNAEQVQANAQNSYESYKTSVNYDALKRNVDQTAARVSALQKQIARANSQIASNQKVITEQTDVQNKQQSKMNADSLKITQTQARVDEILVLLQPYDAEKAGVMQKLAAAQQALDLIKSDFIAHLPQ